MYSVLIMPATSEPRCVLMYGSRARFQVLASHLQAIWMSKNCLASPASCHPRSCSSASGPWPPALPGAAPGPGGRGSSELGLRAPCG